MIATGVAVWVPRQVATYYESEFYFYIWCGHYPFVYSVSQWYLDEILQLKKDVK